MTRNWICGVMKRNDPVTHRFIQYIALQTSHLIIFVRDVSTGKVLYKPPDEELWLIKEKHGIGREVRQDWQIIESVGPEFLERMSKSRRWSVGFEDYYDIIIWDFESGIKSSQLAKRLQISLFKALKYQTPEDLWRPKEHILRSLTFDFDQHRSRDIKSGERSLWIDKAGPGTKTAMFEIKDGMPVAATSEMPEEYVYNEADRLEAEILFPWEAPGYRNASPKQNIPLLVSHESKMYKFENNAPDMERFVLDLDSDEDLSADELDEFRRDLQSQAGNADAPPATDNLDEDEGEADDWEDIINGLDEEEPEGLTPQERAAFYEAEEAYFEWAMSNSLTQATELSAMTEVQKRKSKRKARAEMKQRLEQEMDDEFEIFIDRSRATTFKDCWHNADLESGATDRWTEYNSLFTAWLHWRVEVLEGTARYSRLKQTWQLLAAMEVDPDSHHRIVRDMLFAIDATDLFFAKSRQDFLDTDGGKNFKDSVLLNQAKRMTQIPDRRSPHSNKTRPATQWKEWDEAVQKTPSKRSLDALPKEWDLTLRPIIAKLYRAGIIDNTYAMGTAGITVCLTEPDRPSTPDLFFDWRPTIANAGSISHLQNPFLLSPLHEQAQKYARKQPGARFTVLKIWSSPYFWPLMLGPDNRGSTSFFDGMQRVWRWKFVPKDMPYSEWSIHRTIQMRLEEFGHIFYMPQEDGSEVILRKDMVLVMATSEQLCKWYTAATMFAMQTRPWRLEIDPWKSWFNVDLAFIESLHKKWWE